MPQEIMRPWVSLCVHLCVCELKDILGAHLWLHGQELTLTPFIVFISSNITAEVVAHTHTHTPGGDPFFCNSHTEEAHGGEHN